MRITPVTMGVVTAALAVAAQAYLYISMPPAYGLCVICHGRDLAIWLVSAVTGLNRDVAAVSSYWPLMTVVGIFIGSRYAAITHGEYKKHQGEHPWKTFFYGMAVMMLGLIIMGCPIRLLLRAAYGDPIGLAGALAVLAGAGLAAVIIRWRITRC